MLKLQFLNSELLQQPKSARKERLSPIFVASEQGLDTSVCKRVFKPQRLKPQIQGMVSLWELSLEVEEQTEFMFWGDLRETSDVCGFLKD